MASSGPLRTESSSPPPEASAPAPWPRSAPDPGVGGVAGGGAAAGLVATRPPDTGAETRRVSFSFGSCGE